MNKHSLTGKEKVSYGLGAVGKDMVYMLSASYVLYYFQDILGVSATPDRFSALGEGPAWRMLAVVLGFSAAFTVAALLVDKVRQAFVKLLHIEDAARWAERLAERVVDWIGDRI